MRAPILAVIVVAGLAAACASDRSTATPVDPASTRPPLHRVASGERFEQIAALYGVPVEVLLAANGLTSNDVLEPGKALVIPPAEPASAGAATAVPTPDAAPAEPKPALFSSEWRSSELARARALYEDVRAREGGIFFVGGAALVVGFLALQLLIWLARELVLTLTPLARKLGAAGHDLGLNVWYALWWLGLVFWVPARYAWRTVRPLVEPRARAIGRLALERGNTLSRRAARWTQAQGKRAALAARDEAIDALEELALTRPSLRAVSEKIQGLAYRENLATRSRVPTALTDAWPPSEQEMVAATADGSLGVRFAAMRNTVEGGVTTLEASLIWDRAGFGLVPSTRLTAIVERPGYTAVRRMLLDQLLRQGCARLHAAALEGERLAVALPLSRSQFFDPTLFTALRTVLQESGAPSSQLELGIEERAVLSDLVAAGELLVRLRELGVRTNLRGFGALTLEQLRDLAVDAVTIDFWNSRREERIETYVAESVRAARAAALPVTAARAETPEEIEFARSLGCVRLAPPSTPAPPAILETPPGDNEALAAAA